MYEYRSETVLIISRVNRICCKTYAKNMICKKCTVKSIRMYSMRSRGMYQVQGKKYRIQIIPRHVYIEPVLRRSRKKTNTLKVACTVSRSKQSAAERERDDTCPYVNVYNSYKRAKIGIVTWNVCKSCEECYIGNNKAALEYVNPTNCGCRIECTNRRDSKRVEGNRKVSRDYVNFAVLGKMEAKAEEGPEMDVDGAPPTGQNGKRCRHIVSCNNMLFLARMFTRNLVNYRMFNSPFNRNISIVNLVFDVVHINIYVSDIKPLARMIFRNIADHVIIISQYNVHLHIVIIVYGAVHKTIRVSDTIPLSCSLWLYLSCALVHKTIRVSDTIPLSFSLWLYLSCALVLLLPGEEYKTVESITDRFRYSRYRE